LNRLLPPAAAIITANVATALGPEIHEFGQIPRAAHCAICPMDWQGGRRRANREVRKEREEEFARQTVAEFVKTQLPHPDARNSHEFRY
jgi:hypothetical protein